MLRTYSFHSYGFLALFQSKLIFFNIIIYYVNIEIKYSFINKKLLIFSQIQKT